MNVKMDTGDAGNRMLGLLRKALFCLLVLVFLLAAGGRFYVAALKNAPSDVREMNDVKVAWEFAHGNNPYAPQAWEAEIPPVINVYGFVNPLVYSVVLRLFSWTGFSALQLCEFTTLLWQLLGAVLFYCALKLKTADRYLSFFGMLVFYTCYWHGSAFASAYPDTLGLTISILLMYLILAGEKKGTYHPVLYAVLLIIAFYTKQYFAFLAFGIFVYFLANDVKTLLRGLAASAVLGGLSLVFVQVVFPMYFTEALALNRAGTGLLPYSYSFEQLGEMLFQWYPVWTAILLLGIALVLIRAFRKKAAAGTQPETKGWKNIFSYEFSQCVAAFLPVTYIARNNGARYTYYLQLIMPYLLFMGIVALQLLLRAGRTICEEKKVDPKIWKGGSLVLMALIITAFLVPPQINKMLFVVLPSKSDQAAWEQAYALLDEYKEQGDILVSAHLAQYCLQNGIETADWGQIECAGTYSAGLWQVSRRMKLLCPYGGQIFDKYLEYSERVVDDMAAQKYSCIAVEPGWGKAWTTPCYTDEELILGAGYKLEKELTLVKGIETHRVCFYVRQ